MKKLALIVAILISCTAFSQQNDRQERMKKMMDASPEEMATLQTKRLTLALVLDEKQQKEVYELELAEAKERKANWQERAENMKGAKKTSKADRKAIYDTMLEKQIAHQEKMQKILSEEQFDQWRKMKAKQKQRMSMRDGKRGERPDGR